MVACCASVGVSSVAANIQHSLNGFTQPVVETSTCMQQQNPSQVPIDQLKQQLQLVVENKDELGALAIISDLETLVLNKEVLETTRIGATVNEIRKSTAQRWPEVSKRCRGLIKTWQKLAEFHRPMSSCEGSSNGVTPNLVSPAFKRGLTPHKRITSTDSNRGGRLSALGEQNGGSYAPKRPSPISPFGVHKSVSVGGALSSLKCSPVLLSADECSRDSLPNGADAASLATTTHEKRKATEEPLVVTLKRSKTATTKLTHVPSNISSVVAARKDVQSTAELVAQLSENLPQSMAIDLRHEGENEKPSFGAQETSPKSKECSPVVFYTHSQPQASKPKRKYTKRAPKFFRHSSSSDTQLSSPTMDEEEPNGLTGIAEEDAEPSTSTAEPSRPNREAGHRSTSFNWSDNIQLTKEYPAEYAQPYGDLTSSVVIPIRERQVLLLPYVDIGMPDFVEHSFPDPEQYILASKSRATSSFPLSQTRKEN